MRAEDIQVGMRVRTNMPLISTLGFMVTEQHIEARKADREGKLLGPVSGHGGDVWWVQLDGDAVAGAYNYMEFMPVEHAFVTRADAHNCSVCGLAAGDSCHKRVVSAEDRVRVLRLVEYEGPRAAVERQVENSIHGTRWFHRSWGKHTQVDEPLPGMRITAVTLGVYPEVVEAGREVADPRQVAEMRAEIERLSAKVSSLQLSLYQHEDQSACRPEDL